MKIKIKINFFSHNKLKFQPRAYKVTITFLVTVINCY